MIVLLYIYISMTNVSKKKVKKDVYRKMNGRFAGFIAKIGDEKSSKLFLNEVLTKSERIMLAKRLGVIFMLINNYSFEEIEKNLKVSQTTVANQWKKLKSGDLDYIKTAVTKEKNKRTFLDDLEVLLQAGLPPRGRGRWRWFYEMQSKN